MSSIEITFRDVPSSIGLHDQAMKHIEKLMHFNHRICKCRVVISHSQKHQHQGKLYSTHIMVSIPEKTLVSTKKVHDDAYMSVNAAFIAVTRQLAEYLDQHTE